MYWSLPSGRSRLARSSAYFCLRVSMSIVVTKAVNTKLDRAVKTPLRVRPMAREVVTGYCWPQSVEAGESVGLHLSSSGSRPVRVEVARVGVRREMVFRSEGVAAEEHDIPKDASAQGCRWPLALTLDVDPAWRSG